MSSSTASPASLCGGLGRDVIDRAAQELGYRRSPTGDLRSGLLPW